MQVLLWLCLVHTKKETIVVLRNRQIDRHDNTLPLCLNIFNKHKGNLSYVEIKINQAIPTLHRQPHYEIYFGQYHTLAFKCNKS